MFLVKYVAVKYVIAVKHSDKLLKDYFCPEDGGGMFLQHICDCLSDHMTSHRRRVILMLET